MSSKSGGSGTMTNSQSDEESGETDGDINRRLQRQQQVVISSPKRKLGQFQCENHKCHRKSSSSNSTQMTPARSVPEMETEQVISVPYQQLDSKRLMGQLSSQTASITSDGSQVHISIYSECDIKTTNSV